MIWGRLRRPDVLAGLLIAALLVICALFADWISPHSATRMVPKIKYLPPAWLEGGNPAYLLGTDQLGRDLLSRIIHGARTSLMIAVSAVQPAAKAFSIRTIPNVSPTDVSSATRSGAVTGMMPPVR